MAQESFGLFILFLIILMDFLAIVAVMRIGTRHNDHNDIREVKQSSAIERINQTYNFTPRRAQTEPALPEGEKATDKA